MVGIVPAIDPNQAVVAAIRELLKWYSTGERARAFSSFSRVLRVGDTEGHVSANLVTNFQADRLTDERSKLFTYSLQALLPVDRATLRYNNNDGGSTLVLTTLFWQADQNNIAGSVRFLEESIERMVRWFEGNTIRSIIFTVREGMLRLVLPTIESLNRDSVRRFPLEDGDEFVRVYAPWKPQAAGTDWARRLLTTYKRPKLALASDAARLNGRALHEFGYDVKAALESGITTWSGKASYKSWRRTVSARLNLNPAKDKHADVEELYRNLFRSNPRYLTLY